MAEKTVREKTFELFKSNKNLFPHPLIDTFIQSFPNPSLIDELDALYQQFGASENGQLIHYALCLLDDNYSNTELLYTRFKKYINRCKN